MREARVDLLGDVDRIHLCYPMFGMDLKAALSKTRVSLVRRGDPFPRSLFQAS